MLKIISRNIPETIDTEEKITFVNKQIKDMFGFSSEELIVRPMWDFISDENKVISKHVLGKKEKTSIRTLKLNLYVKTAPLCGRIQIPHIFLIKMVSF